MESNNFSSQKGFSLIEVIVASAIITIILTAAVFAAVSSLRMAHVARNKAIASNLARWKMEEVRKDRDQTVALGKKWPFNPSNCSGSQTISGTPFTLTCNPNDSPGQMLDIRYNSDFSSTTPGYVEINESNDYRMVKVTVGWTDYKRNYETSINTFLTNWQLNPI